MVGQVVELGALAICDTFNKFKLELGNSQKILNDITAIIWKHHVYQGEFS